MLLSEHINETATSLPMFPNKFLSDAMSAPAFLSLLRLKCQGLGTCRCSSLQTHTKATGTPDHQLGGLGSVVLSHLPCLKAMGTPSPSCDGLPGSLTRFCLGS